MAVVTGNKRRRFTPSGGNKGGGDFKDRKYGINAPWKIVKFNIVNPDGAAVPWSPKANKEGKFDSLTVEAIQDIPELGVKKGDERTVVRPQNLKNNALGIKDFSKSISGNPPLEAGDLITFEDLSDYASEKKYKIGDKGFKAPEGLLFTQFAGLFEREINLTEIDGKSRAVVHTGPFSLLPAYGEQQKRQRVRLYHTDRETFIPEDARAILGNEASDEEIDAASDKNVEAIISAFETAFKDYDHAYGTPGAMIRVFPNVNGLGKEEALERATLNPETFPEYYDVFANVPFTTDEDGKRHYAPVTEANVKQMTDNLRALAKDFKELDAKVQNGENMTEEEIARHDQASQFVEFVDKASVANNFVEVIPTSSVFMGKMSLSAPQGKMSRAEIGALNCNTAHRYPEIDPESGAPIVDENGKQKTQIIKGRGGIQTGALAISVNRDWVLPNGKSLPEGVKANAAGVLMDKSGRLVKLDAETGEVSKEGTISEASLSEPKGGYVGKFCISASGNNPASTPELLITEGLKKEGGENIAYIADKVRLSDMSAFKEIAQERKGNEHSAPAQEKKDPEHVNEEPAGEEPDGDAPF